MLAQALLAVLALLLLIAAATDLRSRVIGNWLNLSIAGLAPAFWWATGLSLWPEIAIQILLCACVFALFAFMFAMGWMGGGDVKLLAALSLWLPLWSMLQLLVAMSLLGGLLTLAVMAFHRLRKAPANPEIPYGVAIACAGLWVIGERYLNQFA
jgi:prepilin peptidase CpaA